VSNEDPVLGLAEAAELDEVAALGGRDVVVGAADGSVLRLGGVVVAQAPIARARVTTTRVFRMR
jgi:hypothetical protein